jgi:predicted metal-dependent hydrolase
MLPMTVLRRFDCVLAPTKAKVLGPRLAVRRMSRRWGSCSARQTITMNPALIQAAPTCIDYVMVHELVHLIEPSHSLRFYRLLDRAMPNWRERKRRLANAAIRWV